MKNFFLALFSIFLISSAAFSQPDTLWTRTFGGQYAEHAISTRQTMDGGFIIAGATQSYGMGGFEGVEDKSIQIK